jgi:hypothetical protein
MAGITLLEAAKLANNNGETKRAGVMALFARTSAWLASIPFTTIPGNAYAYDREALLPGIAFRGINEGYTASHGVINQTSEALRIMGGDLDVDVALVRMMGATVRTTNENMKAKALAHAATLKLIKGDSTTDLREFDGLQARINPAGSQFMAAGNSTGGDPLSLWLLDELISRVSGPNKRLWMPDVLRRRLTQAARNKDISGVVGFGVDQFGRQVMNYNGIPIDSAYPEGDGDEPLKFDEMGGYGDGSPGGSTSASIYCVAVGDGYLRGIQNGPMEVRDQGELQTVPVYRTRVEWLASIVVEHPRAVARLAGISNAPVVV